MSQKNSVNQSAAFMELSLFIRFSPPRHAANTPLNSALERHAISGINQIIDKAKQILNIEPGETTEDGLITLELCRCVGACSQAPVVVVDDNIHGRVQPNRFPRILQDIIKSETE